MKTYTLTLFNSLFLELLAAEDFCERKKLFYKLETLRYNYLDDQKKFLKRLQIPSELVAFNVIKSSLKQQITKHRY